MLPRQKPLWKTFLRFLAPMMLSNIAAIAVRHRQQRLSRPDDRRRRARRGVGVLPGDVLPIRLRHGPEHRRHGADRPGLWRGRARQDQGVVGTTLAIGLLLSLSVALVGGFFSRQLMTLLATPADILDQASAYARIMLLTMPLDFVFLLMTAMIRGVGDAVTPLLALALSTTHRTDPDADADPRRVRDTCRSESPVRPGPAAICQRADAARTGRLSAADEACTGTGCRVAASSAARSCRARKVLGIGLPSAVGMVVMAIAELVLLGLVNGFGSDATAAYGAVNQVMGYTQFTAMSISIAVSILGAQAIGGGDRTLLDGIVRTGLDVQHRPDRRAGGADLSGAAGRDRPLHHRQCRARSGAGDCFTSRCGARCRSAWRPCFPEPCARPASP